MISLLAKTRSELGKKTNSIRGVGKIPAVVYGHNLKKNDIIEIDEKDFKKVYKLAGESSLIEIDLYGTKDKRTVLVHNIQKDPITGDFIHIDFFQPNLKETVEVAIPIVFEGVALAEKDLGGTLVKNMLEIVVKALPQNLPHEILVNVESLKTFDDHILVKDLKLPKDVEVLKNPEEIIVAVLPPQKVEEELSAEITENVEDVEKVVKEKKEEDVVEEIK
ncbi:MAG: 50S ribosomal protein L25 [Candidatus Staskawiczbacteria bacterium]|nr:50S ribosomal protein L25 [Candidatus Staskawiczbacteria bacterium]